MTLFKTESSLFFFKHPDLYIELKKKVVKATWALLSDSVVLYYLFPKIKIIKICNRMCIFVYCNKTFTKTPCINLIYTKRK